jgi:hypothetical protein
MLVSLNDTPGKKIIVDRRQAPDIPRPQDTPQQHDTDKGKKNILNEVYSTSSAQATQDKKVVWIRGSDSQLTKQTSESFDKVRHQYRATDETYGEKTSWFSSKQENVGYVYERTPRGIRESEAHNIDYDTIKDLNANRWNFATGDSLSDIGQAPQLQKLELQNCTFPEDGWDNHINNLKGLDYLSVYSPRGGAPHDNFAGLKDLPNLKTLRLVRCEFLNGDCYQNLGELPNLTHLDMTRTITSEKSPGESETLSLQEGDRNREIRQVTELDPRVMDSLHSLMQKSLKTLDIDACSALKDSHRATLHEWGEQYGCAIKE